MKKEKAIKLFDLADELVKESYPGIDQKGRATNVIRLLVFIRGEYITKEITTLVYNSEFNQN